MPWKHQTPPSFAGFLSTALQRLQSILLVYPVPSARGRMSPKGLSVERSSIGKNPLRDRSLRRLIPGRRGLSAWPGAPGLHLIPQGLDSGGQDVRTHDVHQVQAQDANLDGFVDVVFV